MTNTKRAKLLITTVFILLPLISCDNNAKPIREYTEVITMPEQMAQKSRSKIPNDDIHAGLVDPAQNMRDMANTSPGLQSQLDASVASTEITWKTPNGWNETKGSGMRVVTFTTPASTPTETTIITLKGNAGGVEANIVRWARQINLSFQSNEEMSEFINQQQNVQTQDNLDAQIIDFTHLTTADSNSMLAAIISTNTSQIFVKMTGTDSAIVSERDNFLALIKSLKTAYAQ